MHVKFIIKMVVLNVIKDIPIIKGNVSTRVVLELLTRFVCNVEMDLDCLLKDVYNL